MTTKHGDKIIGEEILLYIYSTTVKMSSSLLKRKTRQL